MHLYDNGPVKTCEANSREHCGVHGNACASEERCTGGICVHVGDIITFGHYEQDNDTTNGKEPIEWRILDVKDGKALVISEKALDVKPYNTTEISITWEKSTIRSWLGGRWRS